MAKLVNATLLSLLNEVRVNVCCATRLSSELVGPACGQAPSSNREAGLVGSDRGEGDIEGRCTVYLYCPAFSVSVSLGV